LWPISKEIAIEMGPTLTDSPGMLSVMRIADAQISFADAEMLAQGV